MTDFQSHRLVVELTPGAAGCLDLWSAEDNVNKTTVVLRALEVYRAVRMALEDGGKVWTEDTRTGEQRELWIT